MKVFMGEISSVNGARPQILGEAEHVKPFLPDTKSGALLSAFGVVANGNGEYPLQGRLRAYQQILSNEPAMPPETPDAIIEELEELKDIAANDQYIKPGPLNNYKRKLELAYNHQGGSITLYGLHGFMDSLDAQEVKEVKDAGIYESLTALSALHSPADSEATERVIENDVIPALCQSFGAYCNFIATLDAYSTHEYATQRRTDTRFSRLVENIQDKMLHALEGKDYEEVGNWLASEEGLIRIVHPSTLIGDKIQLPTPKDRLLNQELAVYEAQATEPLLRYLDPEQKHQVNFDAGKKLYDYYLKRYNGCDEKDKSHYIGALDILTVLLTNANSCKNHDKKIDTQDELRRRSLYMDSYKLPPSADSMVFFYSAYYVWAEYNNENQSVAADPLNKVA